VVLKYDSPRIHQALLNIVDNAIKYSNPDGKVNIELKNGKSNAVIVISDSGMGIEENEVEHIFDRFYRIDKARSSDIQGSGLGLSIVKWIVDAHNGKITVTSQLRKGTTFVLTLPRELEE